MKLSRTHRKGNPPASSPAGQIVLIEQLPTKSAKAYVAAVLTLLGLAGIHVTTGTAQAVVMVAQLLLVTYGVWRAHNRPKLPDRGTSVEGYLP